MTEKFVAYFKLLPQQFRKGLSQSHQNRQTGC